MDKETLELKLKLNYLEFKKKAAILVSIWTVAFVAGVALIIQSEFYATNIETKIGSVLIAFMLFARVLFDLWREMKREWESKYKKLEGQQ